MLKPSERIAHLTESQTIMMSRMSRELSAQGKDIINLSLGEPDFDTPQHIKDAAKKAIDEGYTHYPPISGYPDLRQAISDKFKNENGLDFKADQIVVSTGAKQSIANAILCLINPGDEIILTKPYWVSYIELIKLAEGVPVFIETSIENDFKANVLEIEKVITDKTKMFIFSSPCNPTGSVYTKTELEEMANLFAKHPNMFVLSDEIYEHINFMGSHESIGQFGAIKDQLIVINGVSKGYAMTGWRIGYMGAPKWIAQACDKMQGQITSGACSISQKAAKAALTYHNGPTIEMRNAFLRRRDLLLELLKDIPGVRTNVPQGAFYLFPDISYYFGKSDGEKIIQNASDLCMYLMYNALVSVVPGEAFGAPACIRFSYAAADEVLIEAVKRIKNALVQLK